MSALLTIEGVSMRFGAYQALDRIDLAIQQGEFVALLGPSGCGKTTLLKSIAGFLQPESGRILIDGQDVSRLPAHKRPLNTVFQNYALFPHMTVQENVAYGPRRQGASKSEAAERARGALDMVGLADFGPRYPREMSGGQQQRVALARAIVNQPSCCCWTSRCRRWT
ncbi:ATP-binding cassette domain-containing protein [Achromobacter xylosoxidans]